MKTLRIDGIERTVEKSGRAYGGGYTYFFVLENGIRVSEMSVPEWWWVRPSGRLTTGGHVFEPAEEQNP